jgi:uncharacterized cupredoxin-like copper-binding protein
VNHRLVTTVGALGALALLLAGCGDDDDSGDGGGGGAASGSGSGPVAVRMVDNDFDPSALSVEQGDTVSFRFANQGSVLHDAFVGTPDEQAQREADIAGALTSTSTSTTADTSGRPSTGDGSDEPSGGDGDGTNHDVVVPPGETGELTYTFDQPGVYEIGCHQPGHYATGMKVHIVVED